MASRRFGEEGWATRRESREARYESRRESPREGRYEPRRESRPDSVTREDREGRYDSRRESRRESRRDSAAREDLYRLSRNIDETRGLLDTLASIEGTPRGQRHQHHPFRDPSPPANPSLRSPVASARSPFVLPREEEVPRGELWRAPVDDNRVLDDRMSGYGSNTSFSGDSQAQDYRGGGKAARAERASVLRRVNDLKLSIDKLALATTRLLPGASGHRVQLASHSEPLHPRIAEHPGVAVSDALMEEKGRVEAVLNALDSAAGTWVSGSGEVAELRMRIRGEAEAAEGLRIRNQALLEDLEAAEQGAADDADLIAHLRSQLRSREEVAPLFASFFTALRAHLPPSCPESSGEERSSISLRLMTLTQWLTTIPKPQDTARTLAPLAAICGADAADDQGRLVTVAVEKIRTLRSELGVWENSNRAREKERDAAEAEAREARAKVGELRSLLSRSHFGGEAEVGVLKGELVRLHGALGEADKESSLHKRAIEGAESRATKAEARLREVEKALFEAESRERTLLGRRRGEEDEERQLHSIASKLLATEALNTTLNEQLRQAESAGTQLHTRVVELEQRNTQLKSDMMSGASSIQRQLEEERASVEQQLRASQADAQRVESRLEEEVAKGARLSQRIEESERATSKAEEALEEESEHVRSLQRELESGRGTGEELELEGARRQIDSLREELEASKKVEEAKEGELEDMQEELCALKSNLDTARSKEYEMLEELGDARNQLEAQRAGREVSADRADELPEALTEARDLIEDLTQQVCDLEARNKSLEGEIEELKQLGDEREREAENGVQREQDLERRLQDAEVQAAEAQEAGIGLLNRWFEHSTLASRFAVWRRACVPRVETTRHRSISGEGDDEARDLRRRLEEAERNGADAQRRMEYAEADSERLRRRLEEVGEGWESPLPGDAEERLAKLHDENERLAADRAELEAELREARAATRAAESQVEEWQRRCEELQNLLQQHNESPRAARTRHLPPSHDVHRAAAPPDDRRGHSASIEMTPPRKSMKGVAAAVAFGNKKANPRFPHLGIEVGELRGGGMGLRVVEVKGPAEEAGLQAGDQLLLVNGKEVGTQDQMRTALLNHPTRQPVPVVFIRGERRHELLIQPEATKQRPGEGRKYTNKVVISGAASPRPMPGESRIRSQLSPRPAVSQRNSTPVRRPTSLAVAKATAAFR
eukprot:Hpha_TRINITY_DN30688_c0_g1::TRINITY_DN30688_c0_g1_i1::g.18265::m.18265